MEFLEVLASVLEVNPNRRASLMEVQKTLDAFWGEAEESRCRQESRASKEESRITKQEDEPKTESRYRLQEQPSALCEKSSNKLAEASMRKEKKEKDLTLPDEISSYKLQKPTIEPLAESLTTPKNPPSFKENCLYTDPRLLEMIRKDLEDINRLKQSAFYETGKCSYYQQESLSLRYPSPDIYSQPRLSNSQQQEAPRPQFKELKTQEN